MSHLFAVLAVWAVVSMIAAPWLADAFFGHRPPTPTRTEKP